jgi:hypothetical protein
MHRQSGNQGWNWNRYHWPSLRAVQVQLPVLLAEPFNVSPKSPMSAMSNVECLSYSPKCTVKINNTSLEGRHPSLRVGFRATSDNGSRGCSHILVHMVDRRQPPIERRQARQWTQRTRFSFRDAREWYGDMNLLFLYP